MLDLMQMVVKPLVVSTVKPLTLNWTILETAYELYLKAPQNDYPLINLRELSQRSGSSMLECHNTIVEANKLGKFPNYLLES